MPGVTSLVANLSETRTLGSLYLSARREEDIVGMARDLNDQPVVVGDLEIDFLTFRPDKPPLTPQR